MLLYIIHNYSLRAFAHISPEVKDFGMHMKHLMTIVALSSALLSSARSATIYTTFEIAANSTNVGTFKNANPQLYSTADLASGSAWTFAYAYRYFTPSVDGKYVLGMTNASYDSIMFLYDGQTSFPENNPANGLIGFNDDGAWNFQNGVYSYGTQTVDPSAPTQVGIGSLMPLIDGATGDGVALTAGTNYLVAISSFDNTLFGGPNPIPLPAEFFVAGPGAVALDGVSTAAVPEPGSWTTAAALVIGTGFARWRRRPKAAKA